MHNHSEHWQTFPVCFLSFASGQKERIWLQNDPVGFEEIHSTLKKQNTRCIMTILWQADFKEQMKKSVRLLLYTIENCRREDQVWVHLAPSQYSIG